MTSEYSPETQSVEKLLDITQQQSSQQPQNA